MNLTVESLTLITLTVSLIAGLWQIFSKMSDVKVGLEKNDTRLEYLLDKQTLTTNQLQEKINHNTNRLRAESKNLSIRVAGIEGFLMKTTDFVARAGEHDDG